MSFTKTLDFERGYVGGKPVTLLLCFQVPDPSKLYNDQFSVAWRVAPFKGKEGIHEALTARYVSQLFVSNPQIISGNIVKPSQWIEIDPGQTTVFDKDGTFTPPVQGSGDLIVAENESGSPKDFGIGIVENKKAIPLLVFPDIGQGLDLSAEFTPILQAYVVSDYQETTLLKGEIQTKKPIWTKNILTLKDTTEWVFKLDPLSGAYTIVEKVVLHY